MGKFCLSDRLLNKAAVIFVVSLLLLQIFLIQNAGEFTRNQDQLTYLKFASENVENSSWYPSEINVLNNYSFAPGYVNMLILFHKIFGTFSGFSYLNVVLSAILLLEIYIVAKKLFSARVAAFAVLLYCLTYSNWFLPIGYFSDLPFVLFAFTALTICVACKDWRWLLFSGIFLAAANWIRPLAIAYFAGCALFILAERVAVWRKILFLSACTLASILAIGFLTKLNCGVFSFQSTTSGVNLAGSANFKANGLVSFLFEKTLERFTDFVSCHHIMSCLLSVGKIIKNPTKRQIICLYAWLNHNPLTVNALSAVRLRRCKRSSFALQKTVFYTLKGGLSQRKRPPFGKRLDTSSLANEYACIADTCCNLSSPHGFAQPLHLVFVGIVCAVVKRKHVGKLVVKRHSTGSVPRSADYDGADVLPDGERIDSVNSGVRPYMLLNCPNRNATF